MADDNASGVAAVIELARLLKGSRLKGNNYLFVAFSGEEEGLYGSGYFVEHPVIDLGKRASPSRTSQPAASSSVADFSMHSTASNLDPSLTNSLYCLPDGTIVRATAGRVLRLSR